MFFIIIFLLSGYFCLEFLKDESFSKTIRPFFRQILFFSLSLYFILGFLFISESFYFLFPIFFLLSLLWFLQNHKNKSLLSHLHHLLRDLSSQMKLGLSFTSAWGKCIEDIEQKEIQRQLADISEILKFERHFQHPDQSITNLVQDLIAIKKSPQPLKKLNLLEQKVKIEQSFYRRANQILFQLRIQSSVITLLYIGLLTWTLVFYGSKHPVLISISFLCFSLGLFWIFNIGKKMKWSL